MANNIINNPDLLLSETYLKRIIEFIPGSFYVKSKEGIYLACSQTVAQMAGLSCPKEVIGKTDNDFCWSEFEKEYRAHDIEVIRQDKSLIFEEKVRLYDGTVRIFLTTKAPFKDNYGVIQGVIGTSLDITERKMLESDLESSKEQIEILLRDIVSLMPGSVFWKDKKGRYLGCNQFVADMAGVKSPKDIIGKTDKDFPWKERYELYKKHDKEIIDENKIMSVVEPVLMSNGETIIFLSTKAPLKNRKGEIYGVIGTSVDITELKNAQKALALANEEKRKFMFIVATRIRNILAGVQTGYQLLKSELLPDNLSEVPSLLYESKQKITRVFDHVLDYLELVEMPDAKFKIRDFLISFGTPQGDLIEDKKVLCFINYENSLPEWVIGETEKFKKVIKVLVNNAVSYSENGYVCLNAKEVCRTEKSILLNITVADNGKGIAPEKLDGLFDIFERTKFEDPYHSGGLILSLTKMIVDKLGGKIKVSSKVNKGTQFSLELPFELTKETSPLNYHAIKMDAGAIFIARSSWFMDQLLKYIVLDESKLFLPHEEFNISLLNEGKHKIIFIDSYVNFDIVQRFADTVNTKLVNNSFFVVIVGSKHEEKYEHLFNPNTVVVQLNNPIIPTHFEEYIFRNYERWNAGQWSYIKNAISFHRIRVLLVEDELVSSKAQILLLKKLGCHVTHMPSAEQALKFIKKHKTQFFDLIFLDLGLPGMTGLECAKYIKKNFLYKNVPIIAVTAFQSEADGTRCMDAGMNYVIEKPISLSDIEFVLNKYVRHLLDD